MKVSLAGYWISYRSRLLLESIFTRLQVRRDGGHTAHATLRLSCLSRYLKRFLLLPITESSLVKAILLCTVPPSQACLANSNDVRSSVLITMVS